MPGLDAVGHGIYLRPGQPHELKRVLFTRNECRPLAFRDADEVYQLPFGYEVDDSPPMPGNQFLNQVTIEESFDRFNKQMSVDASVTAGLGAFSISASGGMAKSIRSSEEAFYAVRSSCVPLWSVYLSEYSNLIPEINAADIPVPFKHEHRATYERFFSYFGSHYVKRVWLGGKAQLFLTISKSSGMSKEEIHAGLKASFGAGSGSASAQMSEHREKLQSSSQCCLLGKGGDELKLAAMSSLDEAKYNAWIATIRDNPQVIDMDVEGIWTLITDRDKAQALRDAYQEATAFTSISAAFAIDQTVCFVRGRKYFSYHIESQKSDKPRLLTERWPVLASIGFERFDAAFCGRELCTPSGERLGRKLFLFQRNMVARLDVDSREIDPGFPKPIAEVFPGVPFPRLDAAFEVGPDSIFFFQGDEYVRFSVAENKVVDGYPDKIQSRWPGVPFQRIDAAIHWGNGKVYIFKEDQHVRFDLIVRHADAGYPRQIVGNYVEDWRFFD
jgi:hypothetical protein